MEAWFAIVDATFRCKRYEYVLVKDRWISGGCLDEAAAGKNSPRTRAHELFSGNSGESFN
jgi:hypothetical protein